jgi:hypothetical protein
MGLPCQIGRPFNSYAVDLTEIGGDQNSFVSFHDRSP